MSPVNPKFLLCYLSNFCIATSGARFPVRLGATHRQVLLRVLSTFAGLGTVFSSTLPAIAQVNFTWGSGAGEFDWNPRTPAARSFTTNGVTLNFTVGGTATNSANRPIPGNLLIVAGNANTPINAGVSRGNLLLGIEGGTLADFQDVTVDFTNSAGQRVPVINANYSIVDIDRSCNLIDSGGVRSWRWQDSISTRVLLGGASGAAVPLTISSGPQNPGDVGPNNSTFETVQNITGLVGAGFGVGQQLAGGVTFRGISDPTIELLDAGNGDSGCSSDPGSSLDSQNRGVEAANNIAQPPNRAEGNVTLQATPAIDRIEFRFGNGVREAADNGIVGAAPAPVSAPLSLVPAAHGLGILGDFSFQPGIIGVRKQVTQLTNNGDGSFTVTYQVGVTNLGQAPLSNVALDDNIRRANTGNYVDSFGTFGTDATNVTIIPGSLQLASGSGPLTLNGGFDGGASGPGAQLLGAGNTLATGETKTLTYQVRFTPNAGVNQFDSQVVASGTTPGGGITRDRSNDGTTFDSSGVTGDPTSAGAAGSDRLNGAGDFNNSGIAISPGQGDDTVTSFQVAAIAGQPPIIGVTKQVVGSPIDLGGGNYRVRYRQIVRNLGTVPLSNVSLSENLVQTFRRGQPNGTTSFQVDPASITAVGAAPAGFPAGFIAFNGAINPGFNGEANQTIASGATLGIGQYSIVDFDVIVQPGANLGDGPNDPPYDGQVIATGVGGTGTLANTLTTDLSNDATLVGVPQQLPQDVTGNGTANTGLVNGNLVEGAVGGPENTPTPVIFTPSPQIGLTKQVVSVEPDPTVPGSFLVRFRYVVQNIGPVDLNGVNICDNLSTQFNGVDNFEVVGRGPGTNFTVNPTFTGAGSLLNSSDPNYTSTYLTGCQGNPGALSLGTVPGTLTAASPGVQGESATTDIVVRVAPGANLGPYVNNALTFGTGNNAAAQVVTDLSDDTPNPTGGNPAFIGRLGTPAFTGAPAELVDTLTPVLFPAPVALFKTITNLSPSVNGVNLIGPAPIIGAPATVTGATLVNGLSSGTLIQYTLWAFNNSGVPVNNYRICDVLPEEVDYVSGGTLVRVPTLSPISDPACGPDALDRGSGYVIFDVGTLPAGGSTSVNLQVRLRN